MRFTVTTTAKRRCSRPWWGEQYDYFSRCFSGAQQEFANLPKEEQPENLSTVSGACMHDMLLYAYEHLDEFRLILCHAEGTRFSQLVDEMVEIETKATHDYFLQFSKIWESLRLRLTSILNIC